MENPVTQHFGLAYPHPANQTNEEFQRLILMIQALDQALRDLQVAIEGKSHVSHDHQISGVQGLEGELTSLQTSIAALQAPTLASLNDVNVDSAVNGNVLLYLAGTWQSAFLAAANVTYGAGSVEDVLNDAVSSAAVTSQMALKADLSTLNALQAAHNALQAAFDALELPDYQPSIDALHALIDAATGKAPGAHMSFTPPDHQTTPNNAFLKALLVTIRAMDDTQILVAEKAGIHAKVPLYDRNGNEVLASFVLPDQTITASQTVVVPSGVTSVYAKVSGSGGGGGRYYDGICIGGSAGATTLSVNGTTYTAFGGTGGGRSGPSAVNGSPGSATGGAINTTGGGAAGGSGISSGGSGGAGGYCEGEIVSLTEGDQITITIGAAGTGCLGGQTGSTGSVVLSFRGG